MKKSTSFLLIILAILMFNCQCTNISPSAIKAEEDKIKSLDKEWVAAIKAKDIDKICSFYSPDAISMDQDFPSSIGIEAIRKANEKWLSDTLISKTVGESIVDAVEVSSSGDMAWDRGPINYMMNTSDGPVEFVGKWINIWRKIGGQWKVVAVIANNDKPLNAPITSVTINEQFTQIESEWNKAVYNKDAEALDLLYAEEYTYTDPTGKVYNKQQDISEVTSGNYKPQALAVLSDIKVNSYGNIAVVKGLNTSKATLNGKDISGTYRFVDVFVMRDGRWQCISTQSSILPKK